MALGKELFSLRKFFVQGSTLLSGDLASSALGFVKGVLIARTLGVELYGVWGIITVSSSFSVSFLGFRTHEAITKCLPLFSTSNTDKEHSNLVLLLSSALKVDILTRLLVVCVLLGLAPWVASIVSVNDGVVLIYSVYVFSILPKALQSTWFALKRAEGDYKSISLLHTFSALAEVVGVLVLVTLGSLELLALSILILAVQIGSGCYMYTSLRDMIVSTYNVNLRVLVRAKIWRERKRMKMFWSIMGTGYYTSFASSAVKSGDVLLLGYHRPEDEVGLYKLAKRIVTLLLIPSASLGRVIYQRFSEFVASDNYREIKTSIIRISTYWIPSFLAASVFIVVLYEPLIGAIYGSDFVDSFNSFVIMIPGIFVSASLFWVMPISYALGSLKTIIGVNTWVSVAVIVFAFLYVSSMGYVALAIAVSFAWGGISIILMLFSIIAMRKRIRLRTEYL